MKFGVDERVYTVVTIVKYVHLYLTRFGHAAVVCIHGALGQYEIGSCGAEWDTYLVFPPGIPFCPSSFVIARVRLIVLKLCLVDISH